MTEGTRKPEWLKARAMSGEACEQVRGILRACGVNTVCDEALCPNRGTCFNERTATFMILGKRCTRRCAFCNVVKGDPEPVCGDEPRRVAEAAARLDLRYAVVTSVTRDDLSDGGAGQFARTVAEIKLACHGIAAEVLVPDFRGDAKSLAAVCAAGPEVVGHNVETVPSLYAAVRPGADYRRSLELIGRIRELAPGTIAKSGLMAGMGETADEMRRVMGDLREQGCEVLTIGQYLAPSRAHYPVAEYVHPDVFERYRQDALGMGFRHVASGPFVRSSYLAHRAYDAIKEQG